MLKFVRILLAVGLIAAFTFSVAGAQASKATGDIYIATTDPGNTPVTGGSPWTAYTPGSEITHIGNIWIGVDNVYNSRKEKKLTVILTRTDQSSDMRTVLYMGCKGFDPSGDSTTIAVTQIGGDEPVNFNIERHARQFLFVPQPQWEVIKFLAGTSVKMKIEVKLAYPVPSLTGWGMTILVVLLLASAVIVIYRRRKAVTA